MKKLSICVTPPSDEFNNILLMKTAFKRAKVRNKLGVSTHSRYDCKSANYHYNNYQKPHYCSKDYNISLQVKKYHLSHLQ